MPTSSDAVVGKQWLTQSAASGGSFVVFWTVIDTRRLVTLAKPHRHNGTGKSVRGWRIDLAEQVVFVLRVELTRTGADELQTRAVALGGPRVIPASLVNP